MRLSALGTIKSCTIMIYEFSLTSASPVQRNQSRNKAARKRDYGQSVHPAPFPGCPGDPASAGGEHRGLRAEIPGLDPACTGLEISFGWEARPGVVWAARCGAW